VDVLGWYEGRLRIDGIFLVVEPYLFDDDWTSRLLLHFLEEDIVFNVRGDSHPWRGTAFDWGWRWRVHGQGWEDTFSPDG
jgi:hypothetical protein